MSEWQKIESAPKDKQLLLYFPPHSHAKLSFPETYIVEASNYRQVITGNRPSHWMLLPPPPHPKGEPE